MIYVITVPDNLAGYENDPGDFQHALLEMMTSWMGSDYTAIKCDQLPPFEGEPLEFTW